MALLGGGGGGEKEREARPVNNGPEYEEKGTEEYSSF